jgi:hypothetical protein
VVPDAGDERCLRSDDHEVYLPLAAKAEEALDVVDAERMAAREPGDAGVPGRSVQLLERLALRDLPGERVLAASRPHDQDSHPAESKPGGGWFERMAKSGMEASHV